ncbi:hypothetical protein HYALB_00000246 [Hymenoscyphus albidus]|uniref:Uncharacterized protein n=1 Tax=Hymenoscyphus albidus TaxID=595503 RepID=A0A9N9LSL4_9HELO|nr:hypothetical protein HYALB_00000246 [Hymenoscyphus albidus]
MADLVLRDRAVHNGVGVEAVLIIVLQHREFVLIMELHVLLEPAAQNLAGVGLGQTFVDEGKRLGR